MILSFFVSKFTFTEKENKGVFNQEVFVWKTSSVLYTKSCKHSLVLLRMGEIIVRNMLSWLKLLI